MALLVILECPSKKRCQRWRPLQTHWIKADKTPTTLEGLTMYLWHVCRSYATYFGHRRWQSLLSYSSTCHRAGTTRLQRSHSRRKMPQLLLFVLTMKCCNIYTFYKKMFTIISQVCFRAVSIVYKLTFVCCNSVCWRERAQSKELFEKQNRVWYTLPLECLSLKLVCTFYSKAKRFLH